MNVQENPGSLTSPNAYGIVLNGQNNDQPTAIASILSGIIETSPDAIIIADSKGLITFCNNSVTSLFCYTYDELTGKLLSVLIPEIGLRIPPETSQEASSFVLPGNFIESTGLKKDGTEFSVELSLSTLQTGGKGYLTLIARDISERKKVEDSLQKNQAQLLKKHEELNRLFKHVESVKKEWERTIDCTRDIIILTDNSGRIKRCNRALKEFSGLAYEEILWQDWGELLDEHGLLTKAMHGESIELFHKITGRWFVLNSYPFTDEHSEISGHVITIHDTSEIKRITEELRSKNSELQEAHKKLKDTQSKILQQEKMASIGQLAAGIAHEVNNPIGFISSNLGTLDKYVSKLIEFINTQSDLITSLDASETARESLHDNRKKLKLDYVITDTGELIRESLDGADRVKKIVQDLKNFSRLDESENKMADINSGLESTINIVWNELKYKTTMEKEYGDIPMTSCNPGQLNQVFMNILINAAHAIENQGVITVKTWHESDFIYVTISDTGCGIPEDKLSRIFEPFFTTKDVGKGTGLGLSIAYDIVKKHNGEILVQSKQGEGTTFCVKIPVIEKG